MAALSILHSRPRPKAWHYPTILSHVGVEPPPQSKYWVQAPTNTKVQTSVVKGWSQRVKVILLVASCYRNQDIDLFHGSRQNPHMCIG
jgi:hypothetical protein